MPTNALRVAIAKVAIAAVAGHRSPAVMAGRFPCVEPGRLLALIPRPPGA